MLWFASSPLCLGSRWAGRGRSLFLRRGVANEDNSQDETTRKQSSRKPQTTLDLGDLFQAAKEEEKNARNIKRLVRSNFIPAYPTFAQTIERRRQEAKRSLLVQVANQNSAEDLYLYCGKHLGKVKEMIYYKNEKNTVFSDFYIVEFDSADSVAASRDHCHHLNVGDGQTECVPSCSPFVWLRSKPEKEGEKKEPTPVYVPVKRAETQLSQEEIMMMLSRKDESLSSNIEKYYTLCRMTDDATRIRFLACEQIEAAISGMFPKARVLPFGSSVNTFGKSSSDLDMVLELSPPRNEKDLSKASRLIFHAKGGNNQSCRFRSQRYCDQMAHIIQGFLPGCQNVVPLTKARVPIIKFKQDLLGLECDLSVGSLSGYYMSELLYMYGELDPRVRPLVFALRKWAKNFEIIRDPRPTQYLTNFTLSMLVIFYLQVVHKILPPFNALTSAAEKGDLAICEDGVDCTFLRDISGLQSQLNECWNQDSPDLAALLEGFFNFYAIFDFDNKSLCLRSGSYFPKPSRLDSRRASYFMDIANPLEPELNVSANVQRHAVTLFQSACVHSAKDMAADEDILLGDILGGQSKMRLKVNLRDLGWEEEEKRQWEQMKSEEEAGRSENEPKKDFGDLQKASVIKPPNVEKLLKTDTTESAKDSSASTNPLSRPKYAELKEKQREQTKGWRKKKKAKKW